MNPKILLVDDDRDIIEFLEYNLLKEGFDVIAAYNGFEALEKLSTNPDLIILDIMMPKLDGFQTYRKIRAIKGFEKLPVIFLTSRSSGESNTYGADADSNDYILKPISVKKLVARIKSNLQKSASAETGSVSAEIVIGPLRINKIKSSIQINGKEKTFPKKEFEILSYLASHPGKAFTRNMLLKDVWRTNVFVVDRTIDVHVRKIREKLENHSDLIETVKGVGYKFKDIR